jgi:hypothetical protein
VTPPNGKDGKTEEEQRAEVEGIRARFEEAMRAARSPSPPACPPDVLADLRAGAAAEQEMVKARIRGRFDGPLPPGLLRPLRPGECIELPPDPPRVHRPLFADVDFKTGPVPPLEHPGELVIGLGRADETGRSEVVVMFSDANGAYVIDRGQVPLGLGREVVLKAKLPERPVPPFRTFAGLVSLVDPPDPEKLAAKARALGINPEKPESALWLALDAAEEAQKRERAAREAQAKAVRSRDQVGTKLGDARLLLRQTQALLDGARRDGREAAKTKWLRDEVGLAWLRAQAADIDGDLPVAELEPAQLRGVIGVELLRLRRELSEARAEVEAGNARAGELVAERAALRRELEHVATREGLLVADVAEAHRLLEEAGMESKVTMTDAVAALLAERQGLRQLFEVALARDSASAMGPNGECCPTMRAQLAQACPEHGKDCPEHVLGQLADGRIGLRVHDGGSSVILIHRCPWCGATLRSISIGKIDMSHPLAGSDPDPAMRSLERLPAPPKSGFTPEQERSIGSFVSRVTVAPIRLTGKWQVYLDGYPALTGALIVDAATEESAKNLGRIVLARQERPDLWPTAPRGEG